MTHPTDESAGSLPDGATLEAEQPAGDSREIVGPDPVIGAGIALFGIFVMGISGAREAHYVFDIGVGIAVIGAIIFTLFVTISAYKSSPDKGDDKATATGILRGLFSFLRPR